jgi:hypothetical protein
MRRIPMKRTVMIAALLAALAVPAFADDTTTRQDPAADAGKLDRTTTASTVRQQSDMAPTAVENGMYNGCTHRKSALNMM